jgi:hypothetical protein
MHRCDRVSMKTLYALRLVRVHADGGEQDEVPNLVAGPARRACLGQ